MSGLFGNLGQSQQQKPSLFGSLNTSQPAQSGGLFGSLGGGQQQQQPQPASTGLFGSLGASGQQQPQQQQQQQQPAGTGLFGGLGSQPAQQQQSTGSLFGASAQKPTLSLFGAAPQPQQQTTSLFGQPQQQQTQSGAGGLFGASTAAQQPQQQSVLGASQQLQQGTQQQQDQFPPLSTASVWQPRQSVGIREKTIKDQVETLALKWIPELSANSRDSPFTTYLYNSVPEDQIPYFAPGPGDDNAQWEEALKNKPSETSIPVLAKGFRQIGERLRSQHQAAVALQQRLHQINESLSARLHKHDTETTISITKARQRHAVLSRRCLALATKVQVLRNRGYGMDRAEEELRKKLSDLEKLAFDPVLNGRQEEIWARLSVVRERAELLERETKNLGVKVDGEPDGVLDQDAMKTIKKILGDYDSQMAHLNKELTLIQKDFEEWDSSTKTGKPQTRAR